MRVALQGALDAAMVDAGSGHSRQTVRDGERARADTLRDRLFSHRSRVARREAAQVAVQGHRHGQGHGRGHRQRQRR